MEYKAYSFDLDDNLLKLPTVIYLKADGGNIKEFTTHEFEKIRPDLDKLKLELTEDSFRGCRDDDQFLIDIEKATKAGSWENLVNCVVQHASIFAIITARGHSPLAIRRGLKKAIIKHITEEQLEKFSRKFSERYSLKIDGKDQEEILDDYLDLCKFYPVTNHEIKEILGSEEVSELKALAFEDFQKYIRKHVADNFGEKTVVKIGFSDDSIVHLKKMVNATLKKHGLFFYQTDDDGKMDFL
jgi:hypothetical protein